MGLQKFVSAKWTSKEIVEMAERAIIAYFGKNLKQRMPTYVSQEVRDRTTDIRHMVITGLALRMSREEIERMILEKYPDWNPMASYGNIVLEYKRQYVELIDELYVALATRISDVYHFADKIYRIKAYNDIADALQSSLMPSLRLGVFTDRETKAGNLLIKALDRLHDEMGDGQGFERKRIPRAYQEEPRVTGEKVEEYLAERYKGQLPPGATAQIVEVDKRTNGD